MTQFLVEGILVGIIAWIVALPLSFLLSNELFSVIGMEDFLTFSYPPLVAVQGLIGVIAAGASVWPSLAAARRAVSEILRYQ